MISAIFNKKYVIVDDSLFIFDGNNTINVGKVGNILIYENKLYSFSGKPIIIKNKADLNEEIENKKVSFVYDLKNNNLEARKLRITYFGADKNRNFDIFVNEVLVATLNMDGSEGNQFIDKIIELPAAILDGKSKILQVQFKAKPNSSITGIYEVRLLR